MGVLAWLILRAVGKDKKKKKDETDETFVCASVCGECCVFLVMC